MKTRKNFKTLFMLAVAMVLAMAMSITALAAGNTLTINSGDSVNRTYEIYRIFNGNRAEGDVLSNITWNTSAVKSDDLLTALIANNTALGTSFAGDMSAAKVAEEMAKITEEAKIVKLADIISDNVSTATDTKSGSSSVAFDELADGYYFVKETTATAGTDASRSRYMLQILGSQTITAKREKPTVDKKINDNGPKIANEANIGEDVNYEIKSTVPVTTGYDTYSMIFTDTLSKGLTYNEDLKIFVDGVDKTTEALAAGATITTPAIAEGTQIVVTIPDAKVAPFGDGKVITLKYSAKLNDKAVLAPSDNPNAVNLQYSNDPSDSSKKGKTPDSIVKTYTTSLLVQKTEADGTTPLKGAKFKVNKYDDATSAWVEYKTETAVSEDDATLGQLKLDRLGAGKYQIIETEAPAGYNMLTNPTIEITIACLYDADGKFDKFTFTQTSSDPNVSTNVNTGVVTVKNTNGLVLPTTGGIGTTIFYVVGGILVLAAAVLLITKKRMTSEE